MDLNIVHKRKSLYSTADCQPFSLEESITRYIFQKIDNQWNTTSQIILLRREIMTDDSYDN